MVHEGRLPRVDVAELRRQARFAKAELQWASKVPVPDEQGLDELLAGTSSASGSALGAGPGSSACAQGHADSQVCGVWNSEKGECRIFEDHITNRLSYEEPIGDDGDCRLHGWLDACTAEGGTLTWQARLAILEDGETPWYGPSFGEEPETVGDIQVRLLSGSTPPMLETRIHVDGEDEDWQPPVTFRRQDG
mmetsp:Transcript_38498/g.106091  ORF Transcript_38498/g.106091 Transcript_38498/m.106091 type:complete len:192 (+) Transcript_38498:79-654(+)